MPKGSRKNGTSALMTTHANFGCTTENPLFSIIGLYCQINGPCVYVLSAVRVAEDRPFTTSKNVGHRSFNELAVSNPTGSQPNVPRVSGTLRRGHSPSRLGLISRLDAGRRDDRNRNTYRDHDREVRRTSPIRKRSRSPRNRSRSPPRRRARIVPRYIVQVPKISLDLCVFVNVHVLLIFLKACFLML